MTSSHLGHQRRSRLQSLPEKRVKPLRTDGACPPGPDSGVGGDGRAEERGSDWKWGTGRGLSGRGCTSAPGRGRGLEVKSVGCGLAA